MTSPCVFNSEIGYRWQKTQIYAQEVMTNIQPVILTTQLFLTAYQKLLTAMGFAIVILGGSEINDRKKTSSKWFKRVFAQLSEITDW